MRILITIILSLSIASAKAQRQTYKIITKSNSLPGDINYKQIKKLNEPLKAITALYSGMGGSYCSDSTCDLTTALGLGNQGSKAHIDLIKKYFPSDKVANAVVAQQCYLRPSGASTFSEYEYLSLVVVNDTVKVYYTLNYYNRGESELTKGPDIYLLEKNTFRMLKRKLWAWADKKNGN